VAEAGVVVERAGGALVVRAAAAAADGAAYVAGLSAEPGRTAVLVDRSATAALDRLDQLLVAEMHRQLAWLAPATGVRLLADRAAAAGTDGTPPAALRLARRLGVRVIAPDGPLVALRGGELFSAGPAAGWTEFAPDRAALHGGPRYPEPAWQRQLPERLRTPLDLTAIPAGIWLRAAGAPVPSTSDWAFGVPPHPGRLAILLGAPGESHVDGAAVAAVLRELAPALLGATVLIGYGPQPPLGQWLADHLGVPIQVCHALPHYRADGTTGVSAVTAGGTLTWTPYALESTYHPGARIPTPRAWLPPAADLRPAAPATYWLDPHWQLDIVPTGLSIRPATAPPSPEIAALPVDPHWVGVAVTGDPPAPVRGAIDRLASLLPAGVRTRLLTVGPATATQLDLARANRLAVHALPATPDLVAPPTEVGARPGDRPPVAAPAAAPPLTASAPAASLAELSRSSLRTVPTGRSALSAPPARPVPRPASTPPVRTAAAAAAAAGTVAPVVPLQAPRPEPRTPEVAAGTAPHLAEEPRPEPRTPEVAAGTAPHLAEEPRPEPRTPEVAAGIAPVLAEEARRPGPGTPEVAAGIAPVLAAAPRVTAPEVAAEPSLVPAGSPDRPTPAAPERPEPARVVDLAAVAAGGGPAVAVAGGRPTPVMSAASTVDEVMSGPVAAAASTERDRLSFRVALGWRYDAAARAVARLLAERPGLRMAGADEAVLAELAAVRVFASSDQVATVAAMRAGTPDAFHACLYGGLRRLPVLRGLVVRGGPADPSTVDAYRPGQVLLDPAPLVAAADPVAAVPGGVELLVWSRTARRLDGLVDGARGAEVVFAPGVALTVLGVDPPGGRPRRVLLAEDAPTDPERLERIRQRLTAAAAARDAAARDETPAPADPRFDLLPGIVRRVVAA
jgi:hypothetical protein